MFFDKNDRTNFKIYNQELSDVFHHEWAHTWLGSNVINYYSFSSDTRENMADIIMNDFRIKNGKSPIDFRYTIVPFWDEGWTTYYFNNWDKFQEGKWRR